MTINIDDIGPYSVNLMPGAQTVGMSPIHPFIPLTSKSLVPVLAHALWG